MPTTAHVSPTARGAHRTIAAALEATSGKSEVRIVLDGGTYEERLLVEGQVEFVAADPEAGAILAAPDGVTVDCAGFVSFDSVTLVNYSDTPVRCSSGTVHFRHCRVQGHGAEAYGVRALRGTEVTMVSCTTLSGDVELVGATGTFTDCRFDRPVGNCVALFQGSSTRIVDCTFTGPPSHGVRAENGSTVRLERCRIRDTGHAAVTVSNVSEATISDCTVEDARTVGLHIRGRSTASVRDCTVDGAEQGVMVLDDAEATLASLRVERCRLSGLMVDERSRAEFKDCTVRDTGRYGLHVLHTAEVTAQRLDIAGAETAVCSIGGRGRLSGLTLAARHTAVVVKEKSYLRLEDVTVTECATGLEAEGETVSVELADVSVTARDTGVDVGGEAHVTAERCTVDGAGETGISLAGRSRLTASDCTVSGSGADGVLVSGEARLDATRLTVRGSAGTGVHCRDTAQITLRGSEASGNAAGNLRSEERCTRRLVDCTIAAEAPVGGAGGGEGPARGRATAARSPEDGESLAELGRLVGLAPVKRQVRTQVNMIRLAQHRLAAGLPSPQLSRHLVFSGPPGTGKTTVARLYGRILASLGVLEHGEVHEVTRSRLVGQYLGHTAVQVREAFASAAGGVLFIDEAYTLARQFGVGSDFGQEAIDELVALMEDQRDDVVIVVAGYTAEMDDFLDANPGLRSRFSRVIEFPSYGPQELLEITELIAARGHFLLREETRARLGRCFDKLADSGEECNARRARTVFETMVERQAERLTEVETPEYEQLTHLLPEDVPELPWS